jgi:hypothetical protein
MDLKWSAVRKVGGTPEEDFDGAALVHGLVAGGGLVEGELEVEDFAGVDLPVPDQVDQFG